MLKPKTHSKYFDWKTVIHIYVCGQCRTQFMLDLWILITPLVSSNSSSYMYEPYDENTLWRLLRVSISRLLLRFSLTNSNITSLFRFVTKRTIYRLGIISLAHAPVYVAAYIVCDIVRKRKYKLPSSNQSILLYLYFQTYQNRNNSWTPECVLSFNMGLRILINFIPCLWLGIQY
jgi:hypothetical protein